MSFRPRQSTAPRPAREVAQLPPYEASTHPLNASGQRALAALLEKHSLQKTNEHIRSANELLARTAGEVNDRLTQKLAQHEKHKARIEGHDVDLEEEAKKDKEVEELTQRVESMTEEMEQGTRKLIDVQAAVEALEGALREVAANAGSGIGATQQRSTQRTRYGSDDEDDGDENYQSFVDDVTNEDTILPSTMFLDKIQKQTAQYENLSMRDRYAQHNDYIGFKKILHDARNPGEDAPPLPNPSTWFDAPSSSEVGGRGRASRRRDANENDDGDDDVAIARERISIRCPLTQQPFKDPVTSRKCPHSFEREAIMEMISRSKVKVGGSGRRGARDGEKVVQCPVCEQMLSANDLYTDQVLIRRVKRILAAQDNQEVGSDDERSEEDSPAANAEELSSYHGNLDDSESPRVKAERLASSARGASVLVPGTQASDL
ncbi:MAG: hypothetical protein M1819_003389 [Sarea resinae]|nr:MAG: hypothetical protein M1819_003389 [Sarea resinae]